MRVCRIICFRFDLLNAGHWISPTISGKVHIVLTHSNRVQVSHINAYTERSTCITRVQHCGVIEVELCFEIMNKRQSGRLQHTTVVEFPSELRSFHNITTMLTVKNETKPMFTIISKYQCQCSFNAHTHLPSHISTQAQAHIQRFQRPCGFWIKLESNQLSPSNSSVCGGWHFHSIIYTYVN